MSSSLLLIIHLITLLSVFHINAGNVIISTQLGRLKGTAFPANDKTVYNFNGIPYAQPPIGELRFAPSIVNGDIWSTVYDATQPGAKCLQPTLIEEHIIEGDEDCLFLNIFTTKFNVENRKKKLNPVMVS